MLRIFPAFNHRIKHSIEIILRLPQPTLSSVALLCATHHGSDIYLDIESLQTLHENVDRIDSVTIMH